MSKAMNTLKLLGSNKSFGGYVHKFEHASPTLGGLLAKFNVYVPPQANKNNQVPVLFWLSGLTCTEDNFMQKAGAQYIASKNGVAIVTPDTSPRGANIDGEDESYDFGTGAGFYVNATQSPWNQYYQMYDYINTELPTILLPNENTIELFNNTNLYLDLNKVSIFGHSMGGHGSLISYLRNDSNIISYKSVSAFSPICNPINCNWGKKCFNNYLGNTNENIKYDWINYDSTELMKNLDINKNKNEHILRTPILIDQGSNDQFLNCQSENDNNHNQLKSESFVEACQDKNVPVRVRWQNGYDHSYYFISTFIQDHIEFHCQHFND